MSIGGIGTTNGLQAGAAPKKKIEIPELEDKSMFDYNITDADVKNQIKTGILNDPGLSYEEFKQNLFENYA